jgi:hypothetical protein
MTTLPENAGLRKGNLPAIPIRVLQTITETKEEKKEGSARKKITEKEEAAAAKRRRKKEDGMTTAAPLKKLK